MQYIPRSLQADIDATLNRGKSILLLGARQTGKTTLIKQLPVDLFISFIQPDVRQYYEKNPSLLGGEIEALREQKNLQHIPLVIIDEVQKIPIILDVVQDLIDRGIAKFILTGSSARKHKSRSHLNLLPGRVVVMRLDPLSLTELSATKYCPDIEVLLYYGSLPGIFNVKNYDDKEIDLRSYVSTYLEEEIRAEAAVRNIASFSKFLTLAASESGNIVNFSKLSQEIGIAHTTIAGYYQILEDCLIAERIEPLTQSKTRRKLIKTPKYIFFDLGIRRFCAEEGTPLPATFLGKLFEQFVGLALLRTTRLQHYQSHVYFWRDANGPEVDWVIKHKNSYIPVEVKWSDRVDLKDAKHLELFRQEYPDVKSAYIVCRVPRKIKLAEGIYAIPWQELDDLFSDGNPLV